MIRIVIVEDHTLFREGIKSLLLRFDDFKVVAEFADGKTFCDALFDLDSDIVLMDIDMPVMSGIEASKTANIRKPEIKIIALSMYSDHSYYYEMIKAGVSGFVLKEATTTELEKAIRDVHAGMGFFSPELLQKAIVHIPGLENKKRKLDRLQLTNREAEVLDLICKGFSNQEFHKTIFESQNR
ncbi:MAG: response regulator transcription factor [Bacteroidales bacterium]|nr:response regulator transcription factor [Bacteroidales bacterium]